MVMMIIEILIFSNGLLWRRIIMKNHINCPSDDYNDHDFDGKRTKIIIDENYHLNDNNNEGY
jgi:hypothetical protein